MLTKEVGTASNIKDKGTRKKVQRSLRRVISQLKRTQLPPNGLIVYGYDKGTILVEPHFKNILDDYHCGRSFRLDYMNQPSANSTVIKLCLSIKEAKVVKQIGTYEETLHSWTSGIPGDHSKGGQSQNRYTRKHREAVRAFMKRVYRHIQDLDLSPDKIEGEVQILALYDSLNRIERSTEQP